MTLNKTTKVLSLAILMVAMTGMTGFNIDQAFAVKPGNDAGGVGKGGYQLNLIGMDKHDKLTNDDNSGHRIFVKLNGHSKIKLQEGPFKVIDADATDGGGALFQLPYPGNCDTTDFSLCDLDYSVYMRVLGKPVGGTFNIVTCAEEVGQVGGTAEEDETLCSVESVSLPNANGPGKKSKFTNVSKELLTICIDTDITVDSGVDGILDNDCDLRAEIFDDKFVDFAWEVDANGHRLAQLRFIQN